MRALVKFCNIHFCVHSISIFLLLHKCQCCKQLAEASTRSAAPGLNCRLVCQLSVCAGMQYCGALFNLGKALDMQGNASAAADAYLQAIEVRCLMASHAHSQPVPCMSAWCQTACRCSVTYIRLPEMVFHLAMVLCSCSLIMLQILCVFTAAGAAPSMHATLLCCAKRWHGTLNYEYSAEGVAFVVP